MPEFRCYDPSADGGGGIHAWYNTLSAEFRAQVDAALEILALEDNLNGIAEVKPLRGACEGLTEIIIDFRVGTTKVCIRVLGFDGPGRDEFTLLTGFERGKDTAAIYGYHCPQAHQRKQGVMHDGRRAPPCRFP